MKMVLKRRSQIYPALSDKENERLKKVVSKDSTVKGTITIEVYSIYKMPKPITD